MLPQPLSWLLGSAAAPGDFFKIVPGAVAFGALLWKIVRRPDCRLLPVEQGVQWWERFQPCTDWQFKAKIGNDSIPADEVVIEFTLVEVSDSREQILMRRRPEPIELGPMREPRGNEIMLRLGGALRKEQEVNPSSVSRLRLKGRVTSRARLGLRRRRAFDLYMDRDGSHRGALRERV